MERANCVSNNVLYICVKIYVSIIIMIKLCNVYGKRKIEPNAIKGPFLYFLCKLEIYNKKKNEIGYATSNVQHTFLSSVFLLLNFKLLIRNEFSFSLFR